MTVARFRNFVNAYNAWVGMGNPAGGAGANPNVGSSGWNTAWTIFLPANAADLTTALQCDSLYQTWSASGNGALPINCVDWYEAFAFCIWDGGRLPTESEREYAAAGGSHDYMYPWSNTPVPTNAIDGTDGYAAYSCLGDGNSACSFADILAVGSKPAGKGLYGQFDLAGLMWEWGLDWVYSYPSSASTNYAKVDTGVVRALRGGDWTVSASYLAASGRYQDMPSKHDGGIGLRCARAP